MFAKSPDVLVSVKIVLDTVTVMVLRIPVRVTKAGQVWGVTYQTALAHRTVLTVVIVTLQLNRPHVKTAAKIGWVRLVTTRASSATRSLWTAATVSAGRATQVTRFISFGEQNMFFFTPFKDQPLFFDPNVIVRGGNAVVLKILYFLCLGRLTHNS